MELWHGRRGKDVTGSSMVCGRTHRNMLLIMVAMVVTLAVVLLRESSPIDVTAVAQSPVLKVPGSVYDEPADSFPQRSLFRTPPAAKTDEGLADLTEIDVSPTLEETEPKATVLEAPLIIDDEPQETKPNSSAIVIRPENSKISIEESISTAEETLWSGEDTTTVAIKEVPLTENATISEATLTLEEKAEISLEANPDESIVEEAGVKGADAIEAIVQESEEKEDDEVECDYSVGKWVLDDTRPLYSGFECKLWLSQSFACRLHSHPDKLLDKYRWQPAGCNLPVFNSSGVLEMLRNKVVAFVGDSLGRQQFQSLMCMLTRGKNDTAISDVRETFFASFPKAPLERKPSAFAFRFDATNTTIVYKWSVTLARIQALNVSDPVSGANALHLDRPELMIEELLPVIDVLVLNSGHHWNNGKMKQNRFEFYLGGKRVKASEKVFKVAVAYKAAVHNVLGWIHNATAATPEKIVYYRSLSPRHFRNGDWDTGGTCDTTTIGLHNLVEEALKVDPIAESAVMGTTVNLLNVTSMSLERGETHVSKYGGGKGSQDCLHWCLPGIPDTWNEILFASLATKFERRRQFGLDGST